MGLCHSVQYTHIPFDDSDVTEPPPSAFSSDDSDIEFEVVEVSNITTVRKRSRWSRIFGG